MLLLLLLQLGLVNAGAVEVEPEGLGEAGQEGGEERGHGGSPGSSARPAPAAQPEVQHNPDAVTGRGACAEEGRLLLARANPQGEEWGRDQGAV